MIKSEKNSHIKLKNNSFHDINTIDDINEKSFFTTKKIIVFTLFFLLTLTLFACTVIFVFKTILSQNVLAGEVCRNRKECLYLYDSIL